MKFKNFKNKKNKMLVAILVLVLILITLIIISIKIGANKILVEDMNLFNLDEIKYLEVQKPDGTRIDINDQDEIERVVKFFNDLHVIEKPNQETIYGGDGSFSFYSSNDSKDRVSIGITAFNIKAFYETVYHETVYLTINGEYYEIKDLDAKFPKEYINKFFDEKWLLGNDEVISLIDLLDIDLERLEKVRFYKYDTEEYASFDNADELNNLMELFSEIEVRQVKRSQIEDKTNYKMDFIFGLNRRFPFYLLLSDNGVSFGREYIYEIINEDISIDQLFTDSLLY